MHTCTHIRGQAQAAYNAREQRGNDNASLCRSRSVCIFLHTILSPWPNPSAVPPSPDTSWRSWRGWGWWKKGCPRPQPPGPASVSKAHTSSKLPQGWKNPGLQDIKTKTTMFYECSRHLFPELTTIINSFTAVSFIAFPGGAPTCCLRSDPVQLLRTERLAWQLAQAGSISWQLGGPRQGSPGTVLSAWTLPPLGREAHFPRWDH